MYKIDRRRWGSKNRKLRRTQNNLLHSRYLFFSLKMATSRARALTVSSLDNMMENKPQIVGKQFIQPATRGTRGVLGDIRNKGNSKVILKYKIFDVIRYL